MWWTVLYTADDHAGDDEVSATDHQPQHTVLIIIQLFVVVVVRGWAWFDELSLAHYSRFVIRFGCEPIVRHHVVSVMLCAAQRKQARTATHKNLYVIYHTRAHNVLRFVYVLGFVYMYNTWDTIRLLLNFLLLAQLYIEKRGTCIAYTYRTWDCIGL